ncbi:MAG: hypothetical protein ACE5IR_02140 [bacterium]
MFNRDVTFPESNSFFLFSGMGTGNTFCPESDLKPHKRFVSTVLIPIITKPICTFCKGRLSGNFYPLTTSPTTPPKSTLAQAAHKKGVAHRDIKSANIEITDEEQVKIMDFELAKLTGQTILTKSEG